MAGRGLRRTLHRGPRIFLVALLGAAAACADENASGQDGPPDLTAFCANAPDADAEVSADYVGSTDHVIDIQQLAAHAPAALRDELDLIARHFDDQVDPAEPESQMVENFPDEVNAAVARVVAFIDENCET